MWSKERLPLELKDAFIAHLYKCKGDRLVCDNHHGISLLFIDRKILARVMLNRLTERMTCSPRASVVFVRDAALRDNRLATTREVSGAEHWTVHHLCGPSHNV
mgnify:CR=1 FL=1